MNDRGALVITGATGTVGRCLTARLREGWPGGICTVGRTRPDGQRAGDRFLQCDLADPGATALTAGHLADGPPAGGLVCAAGLDSRAGVHQVDPRIFGECMQVNCLAHLQLLRAVLAGRRPPALVFPAVVISSDVVGERMPATAVYAAAKAAAEECFRHATADIPEPGAALLLVRMPYVGVPMRAAASGPQPPPRTPAHQPLPVLAAAVEAVTRFITSPRPAAGTELWRA